MRYDTINCAAARLATYRDLGSAAARHARCGIAACFSLPLNTPGPIHRESLLLCTDVDHTSLLYATANHLRLIGAEALRKTVDTVERVGLAAASAAAAAAVDLSQRTVYKVRRGESSSAETLGGAYDGGGASPTGTQGHVGATESARHCGTIKMRVVALENARKENAAQSSSSRGENAGNVTTGGRLSAAAAWAVRVKGRVCSMIFRVRECVRTNTRRT